MLNGVVKLNMWHGTGSRTGFCGIPGFKSRTGLPVTGLIQRFCPIRPL